MRDAISEVIDNYLAPVLPKGILPLVGQTALANQMILNFDQSELGNELLLGPAGAGKTKLLEHLSVLDKARDYMDVNLTLMQGDHFTLEQLLQALLTVRHVRDRHLVLVFDDQVLALATMNDNLAVLNTYADRLAVHGVSFLMTSTMVEYEKCLAGHAFIVHDCQKFLLSTLKRSELTTILRQRVELALPQITVSDELLNQVIAVSERSLPEFNQPRQSLMILDAMIGYAQIDGDAFNLALLTKVINRSY